MAFEYDFNKDLILQSDEKNVWISFNIFDNGFDKYYSQQQIIKAQGLEFIPIVSYNIFDNEDIIKCYDSFDYAKELIYTNRKNDISKNIFPSNNTSIVLGTNKKIYKFTKYLKLPFGMCVKSIKADSTIKIELEYKTSIPKYTHYYDNSLIQCSRNFNYIFDTTIKTGIGIKEIKLDANNQINKFDKYFDKNGLDHFIWNDVIVGKMPELTEYLQDSFASGLYTSTKINDSENYYFIFSSNEENEHSVEIEFYNVIITQGGMCEYSTTLI